MKGIMFNISAATLKKNCMFESYHKGAYGLVKHNKWSCCNATNRDAPGCQKIKATQARRNTMSFQKRDNHSEPDTESIKRSNTVSTFRHTSLDTQSIGKYNNLLQCMSKSNDSCIITFFRQWLC